MTLPEGALAEINLGLDAWIREYQPEREQWWHGLFERIANAQHDLFLTCPPLMAELFTRLHEPPADFLALDRATLQALRDALASGEVLAPNRLSIARYLIEDWYGGSLGDLGSWR